LIAESRLTPISFFDFYAYPLPLCELRFDEAADFFSGASPASLAKRHGGGWATPALRSIKEATLAGGGPRNPLDGLRAKLDLLEQASTAVAQLHEKTGAPHLQLSPAQLLVKMERGSPIVKLAGPGAPRRLRGLSLPPLEPFPPFAPDSLSRSVFGREHSVRVHVGKVWSDAGETFFGAVLEGDGLPVDETEEADEIRLALSAPGWEDTEIWAHRLPSEERREEQGALALVTAPADLTAEQVNDLKAAKGKEPLFGKVTVYRSYGIPFDVHALGMLLFRTLLVNEVQSFDRVVSELVEPLSGSLELLAATRPGATLDDFGEMLQDELRREPVSRFADSRNVWSDPDRADDGVVPGTTWRRLLTLGLRCVTLIEGFSLCASDRDTGESAPVRTFLDELAMIGEDLISTRVAPQRVPIPESIGDP
jgi:hypothetical protein